MNDISSIVFLIVFIENLDDVENQNGIYFADSDNSEIQLKKSGQ